MKIILTNSETQIKACTVCLDKKSLETEIHHFIEKFKMDNSIMFVSVCMG